MGTKGSNLMKILIIRRDNIGDLVCTTPLISALRKQLPNSQIDVLSTRYNHAVLERNPDVDNVYHYTKAKHRHINEPPFHIYWERLKLIWRLRRNRYDWVLLPGGKSRSADRFARWIHPRRIISQPTTVDSESHEVEQVCHLLPAAGLTYETPPVTVIVDPLLKIAYASQIKVQPGSPCVGIHISARKPSQHWPAERFAELITNLRHHHPESNFLLFWAPGSSNNPEHPGDDEKADAILKTVGVTRIHAIPTHRLEELIAALSLCNIVICADGGAMHLAAGLEKPIVALFGKSDAHHWRPWGVPQVILQKPSLEVSDISVTEVADAVQQLYQKRDI